jgi:hypothetical protein
MIDNQDQVDRLMPKLEEALPLRARAAPGLLASMRGQAPDAKLIDECTVLQVFYSGDEGGIVCALGFGDESTTKQAFVVSITHLSFDPRLPVAREIAAYQKHRIKRLGRLKRTDNSNGLN